MTDYLNDSEAKRAWEFGCAVVAPTYPDEVLTLDARATLYAKSVIEHQAAEIERYRRKAAFWSDRAAWNRKRLEAAEEKLAAATTALNQQGAENE